MYPDGFHVHAYPSGSRYEGNWKNGRKHGKGTYTYAGGGQFVGETTCGCCAASKTSAVGEAEARRCVGRGCAEL
ncbi:hypothetical protein T484DRAFT_1834984 [Baffinella frigidus]|nr:hypothetical protein T484DRAFT_1834984 [Cryptophyta sp. CCMP2293]